MIVDGALHYGCPLEQFPDRPLTPAGLTMRRQAGLRGFDVRPFSDVADVEPAQAFVQQGWLVVACPDCKGTPEEELAWIWRDGPHIMLCLVCGNRTLDGYWRPVALPARFAEIEALLSVRPMQAAGWMPGGTIGDLEAENIRFGWTSPGDDLP